MMRLVFFEPKNWVGFEYRNPCHYKINFLSILDKNIRKFGEQNVTFVGENISFIRLKYPQIQAIDNHLKSLTDEAYDLLLALKRDNSSTFVTTCCVYVNDFIIKSINYSNCEVVDEQLSNIGVYYLSKNINMKLIKNINRNYHQSISDLLSGIPEIKKVVVSKEDILSFKTSNEYLKCFKKITNISFEELTNSNAEKLLKFYLKQPIETRNYYKPHSFEIQDIKKLANGSNIYLLAFKNNEVVGYGSLQGMEFDGPPSLGLLVDNQERGSGLAFALGITLIEKAKKLGLDGIIGNLSIGNFAAMKLDKMLGFEFKLVKNSRIYGVIDFYHKGIVIPQHYIEKTCQKKETWNR